MIKPFIAIAGGLLAVLLLGQDNKSEAVGVPFAPSNGENKPPALPPKKRGRKKKNVNPN